MYHHILGSFVDVLAFFIELFILFIQEEGYSKETSFGNSAVIKLDELHDFIPSYLAKGWAASWLARSGSVAPQQVLSSILIRSEFPAVGVKKPPRCARREAWSSRAWARVRGFSLPG